MGLWLLVAIVGTSALIAGTWPVVGGWAEFTCGACAFVGLVAQQEKRRVWPWLSVIIALSVASRTMVGPASFLPFSGAFALALFWLNRHDARLARLRAGAWLAWLGATSYSLYLIHVPVLSPLRNVLGRLIPIQSPLFLFAIALCIAAGRLFFRRIETPSESWRKSLDRSGSPGPAVP